MEKGAAPAGSWLLWGTGALTDLQLPLDAALATLPEQRLRLVVLGHHLHKLVCQHGVLQGTGETGTDTGTGVREGQQGQTGGHGIREGQAWGQRVMSERHRRADRDREGHQKGTDRDREGCQRGPFIPTTPPSASRHSQPHKAAGQL